MSKPRRKKRSLKRVLALPDLEQSKLKQEERLLLRGSPDEYPTYNARVKALIPYVI